MASAIPGIRRIKAGFDIENFGQRHPVLLYLRGGEGSLPAWLLSCSKKDKVVKVPYWSHRPQ